MSLSDQDRYLLDSIASSPENFGIVSSIAFLAERLKILDDDLKRLSDVITELSRVEHRLATLEVAYSRKWPIRPEEQQHSHLDKLFEGGHGHGTDTPFWLPADPDNPDPPIVENVADNIPWSDEEPPDDDEQDDVDPMGGADEPGPGLSVEEAIAKLRRALGGRPDEP